MSEIAPTNEPQNPGSLRSFAETQGLDPASKEAMFGHADALARYRAELADSRGISAEQLHGIGGLAVQQIG